MCSTQHAQVDHHHGLYLLKPTTGPKGPPVALMPPLEPEQTAPAPAQQPPSPCAAAAQPDR